MKNIAEFQIIGNIGRIQEVGKALKVSIASNYPSQNETGEWEQNTHWNTITLFKDLAAKMKKYAEGDLIFARGRIRQNQYEKDGQTIYTVDLLADECGRLAKPVDQANDD